MIATLVAHTIIMARGGEKEGKKEQRDVSCQGQPALGLQQLCSVRDIQVQVMLCMDNILRTLRLFFPFRLLLEKEKNGETRRRWCAPGCSGCTVS